MSLRGTGSKWKEVGDLNTVCVKHTIMILVYYYY